MILNARFYNITTTEQNDAANMHPGEFDNIADAVEFCVEHGIDVELTDAAGFVRGWAHANGKYSMTGR